MSSQDYEFPVYGTQGGGLAQLVGHARSEKLIWVETPADFPEFTVGEEVPREWDYQPANEAARAVMYVD